MKSLNTNKVFISAFVGALDENVNEVRHEGLMRSLKQAGIEFREMRGVWGGKVEKSLLMEAYDVQTHKRNLRFAIELGRMYDQEAVLEVHNDNAAELHIFDGDYANSQSIGTFKAVPKADAIGRDAFTVDPITGIHYVVER